MRSHLQIVLPIRNATAVLRNSIQSLATQTDRDFSVLLSDNWSTSGGELLDEAEQTLSVAGIATRRVRPPESIGRVEHWNWSHHASDGDWIKPLFTGDWLEPEYVRRTQEAIAQQPGCAIVRCSMASHRADGQRDDTVYAGGWQSPSQVLEAAYREGNNLGAPVNVCFRRLSFICVGGYPPALPVSADFWLYLQLALQGGLTSCPEVMAHFDYHPSRFSTNFPMHRINGDREQFLILLGATSQADFAEIPRDVRLRNRYFLRLAKRWVKTRLR